MKEIPFDADAMIEAMRDVLANAQGKLTLKTTIVTPKPKAMSPATIAGIRRKLKASTPVFASYLNVEPVTVRSWEKGRRVPSGPALRLLQIAKERPEILRSA